MGRISRILNFTCTDADTWYKAFDEADYKNQPIQEVKVKLRESSTADHFRYNYASASPSTWMTSTSGYTTLRNVKQLFVYVPTEAAQVIEIEVIYK